MPGVKVLHISNFEVHEVIEEKMPWNDVVEVPGILKAHSMICENDDEVRLYRDDLKEDLIARVSYSSESDNVDDRVNDTATENVEAYIGDWIVIMYDSKKYLGKVTSLGDNMGMTVSMMHPCFPSGWKWPEADDVIYCQQTDILKKNRAISTCQCQGNMAVQCSDILMTYTGMYTDGGKPSIMKNMETNIEQIQ